MLAQKLLYKLTFSYVSSTLPNLFAFPEKSRLLSAPHHPTHRLLGCHFFLLSLYPVPDVSRTPALPVFPFSHTYSVSSPYLFLPFVFSLFSLIFIPNSAAHDQPTVCSTPNHLVSTVYTPTINSSVQVESLYVGPGFCCFFASVKLRIWSTSISFPASTSCSDLLLQIFRVQEDILNLTVLTALFSGFLRVLDVQTLQHGADANLFTTINVTWPNLLPYMWMFTKGLFTILSSTNAAHGWNI